MDEQEDTNVVSSSSSPSSVSSSSGNSTEYDENPYPRGTRISLQGQLLFEMDNALCVNVDWRGRNYKGTLIKVNDPNSWEPQRLQNPSAPQEQKEVKETRKRSKSPECKEKENNSQTLQNPSAPQEQKEVKKTRKLLKSSECEKKENNCQRLQNPSVPQEQKEVKKTRKRSKSPECKKKENNSQRQKGSYSVKYPRSFVDSSNIVESKLRYGRDKKVASYKSCPNSPKHSSSRLEVHSISRSRKSASISAGSRRSLSLSYDNVQNPKPSSSKCRDTTKQKKTKSKSEAKETQCNEVGSSKPNYESPVGEEINLISSDENSADMEFPSCNGTLDQQSKRNTRPKCRLKFRRGEEPEMPHLHPLTISDKSKLESISTEAAHNTVTESNLNTFIDSQTLGVDGEQSSSGQSFASPPRTNNLDFYSGACAFNKPLLPSDKSESSKTYVALNTNDLDYLNIHSNVDAQEDIFTPDGNILFYTSPTVEGFSNDGYGDRNVNNIQFNANLAEYIEDGLEHVEQEPMLELQGNLNVEIAPGITDEEVVDTNRTE